MNKRKNVMILKLFIINLTLKLTISKKKGTKNLLFNNPAFSSLK